MFCRKCGKEIGDAKFCSFCGEPTEIEAKSDFDINRTAQVILEKVRTFGHVKLSYIISLVCAAIGIWIRIQNNVVEVVYSALASVDYFVLSEQGKTWMLFVIVLQVLFCGIILYDARKTGVDAWRKGVSCAIAMLVVQILAMTLRLPAPY